MTRNSGNSTQVDSNRQILLSILLRTIRGARRKPAEFRHHVAHEVWSATKRFGSSAIENIDVREIPALRDAVVEGYVDDRNRTVVAALCRAVAARTFFEIGTNRGRTAWTVARNSPDVHVFTLDLPGPDAEVSFDMNDSDRAFFDGWSTGEAFHETAEAERITALFGDSATFDFSPYARAMDVVYVDGAHSYSYVRSDTRAALAMVAPGGTIVWDDYPAIVGVYRWLNELAPALDPPPFHILGTRLVVHTHHDLVSRLTPEERSRPEVA